MKIKLALLDNDQNYLNRIVSVFNIRYADKLEIYSFTRIESALSALESTRIDVFVSSVAFDVNTAALPKRCGFAYFVDSADIDSVNNQRAICKYQKADLIYRQILSIYSENAGGVSETRFGDDSAWRCKSNHLAGVISMRWYRQFNNGCSLCIVLCRQGRKDTVS